MILQLLMLVTVVICAIGLGTGKPVVFWLGFVLFWLVFWLPRKANRKSTDLAK